MPSINVETFAAELKVPADVLLEQLRAAGVQKRSASDALSEADGPAATYLDMFKHNADLLIPAMGGK